MTARMLRWLTLVLLMAGGAAQALTAEQARAIAAGDTDDRIAAMNQTLDQADERTAAFLQALGEDAVKLSGDRVFMVRGDKTIDAVTGADASLPADAEDAMVNNRLRGEIDTALAAIKLFSRDTKVRASAVATLLAETDESKLPLVQKALAAETDDGLREQLEMVQAAILLGSPDVAKRLEAARMMADGRNRNTKTVLLERLRVEEDPKVKAALSASLVNVDERLAWGNRLGAMFSGVSLGSILLLVALGLAITYGLMGVINMAHGELIMIGAYATWLVQVAFKQWLPGWFDWYLLAAMPVAFMASALVGAAMERSVIRYLYGRPLETLLATWGLSLVLMQGVRSLFGAQNVGLENPVWMSGSVTLLGNLTLPWNRIFIIAFAAMVLLGVVMLISRTRLGLFVRGVTQNRPIAACMGVNTARIDTYAFALGSGIAGLAGCALSQIGNVGPDLGQSYIVDSFMVVVLGGVGQIAGTVYAALGLGVLNKFIEGWAGAVLAKIAVLVFIIVFIQKRPQGIFAFKGRET